VHQCCEIRIDHANKNKFQSNGLGIGAAAQKWTGALKYFVSSDTPKMDKKTETVTFRTTPEIARALSGIASVDDQSRSDFIHQLASEIVLRKTAYARLLIDALGIKLL